ncbi:serine/threonine-protein kinase/endoribonuclease IRE1-like [Bolinopsis microptera]|uniref:serine/threonine-protein kinase/endoribonuclease IRE1-like n=1 Tax=Bolinopsis microptera TaxID=2820187 RepID=UPI00307A5DB8
MAVQQVNETRLLRKFNHPNVVRYYLADSDLDFVYIALELCEGCLVDYIEKTPVGEKFLKLHSDSGKHFKKVILNDVLSGLNYLHDLDIIHGDIKPQNILLRKVKQRVNLVKDLYFEGVLSDFGLSLEIDEGRRSKTAHDNLIGSDGWRAKEVLTMLEKASDKSIKKKSKKKVKGTKAVDIFSFGCVMQYVMTEKSKQYYMHPFGDINHRNYNIRAEERRSYLSSLPKYKSWKPNLNDVLADMLIEICVLGNPELRPTTKEIAKNPFFWDATTMIQFLERVFNDIKSASKDSGFGKILEDNWSKYHKQGFTKEIREAFNYNTKHNSKSCSPHKLCNFLRILRNIRQHYQEIVARSSKEPICKALSDCLGQGGDEDFSRYFLEKVAGALPVVYLSFIKHPRIDSYHSYYSLEDLNSEVSEERFKYQWTTLDKVLLRQDNDGGQVQRRSRTPSGQGSSESSNGQERSQTPNANGKGRSRTPSESRHGK